MSASPRTLTRRQVADLLGVHKRTVARLDGRELHPFLSEDGKTMLYPYAEAMAYVASRVPAKTAPPAALPVSAPARPPARSEGEITAAGFDLLDEGRRDIVQALRITADKADAIECAYARRRGALLIAGEARERLRQRHPGLDTVERLLDRLDDLARDAEARDDLQFVCMFCQMWKPITPDIWEWIRKNTRPIRHACKQCEAELQQPSAGDGE